MKFLPYLVLFSVIFTTPSLAVQLTIQDPCAEEPWLQFEEEGMFGLSVGQITVKILERFNEKFVGHEGGIRSIRTTPLADDAIEIVNANEMRAYGWCYHVNGVEAELMPDQFKIAEESTHIYWFFSYAEYINGQWTSMCTPTHITRPSFICR